MANLSVPEERRGSAWWRWLVVATLASLLLTLVPVMARVALAAAINVNVRRIMLRMMGSVPCARRSPPRITTLFLAYYPANALPGAEPILSMCPPEPIR